MSPKRWVPAISAKSAILYGCVAAFAGWCAIRFRADLAGISLRPILDAHAAIALASLLALLNYASRAIRWHLYLTRLGLRLTMGFTTLTFIAGFAFSLSPGKVGELMRARYYVARGLTAARMASAFFVDRILDVLAMATLAVAMSAASSAYGWVSWAVLAAAAASLILLGAAPWTSLQAFLARRRWLSKRLQAIFDRLTAVLVSAKALLTPGMLLTGFSIGLLAWGLEGVGLKVLGAVAPSVRLDLSAAIGIYSVAVIAGSLSLLPGGLGSTEAIMAALLTAHGYTVADAILLTLLCRLVTLWLAVGLGWVAVLALRRSDQWVVTR